MKQTVRLFLFLAIFVAPFAFAGGRGGLDGGGGHVARSTPKQVRETLERALRYAAWNDSHTSIFYKFMDLTRKKKPDRTQLFYSKIDTRDYSVYWDSPILRTFSSRKITIKESGDCGSARDNHADASVTSFTARGDVCFSVANLTRIAPDVLLRETLALILHEAAHLAGAPESEAQIWQALFRDYYIENIGSTPAEKLKRETRKTLKNAADGIKQAIELHRQQPNDSKIYALLGRIAGVLPRPEAADRDLFEINLQPVNSEGVATYIQSVDNMNLNIEVAAGLSGFAPPAQDARLARNLETFAKDIATLQTGFEALFIKNAKVECVLYYPVDERDPPFGPACFWNRND